MEFKDHVDEAKRWTDESGTNFVVTLADETEQRIYFQIKDGTSFYISGEKEADVEKWMVWSDDDSVLPKLESFQEFTDRSLPLEDLLNKIDKVLSTKAEEEDDDEDCDEVDDFENYYNDDDVDAAKDEKEESDNDEDLEENFFTGAAAQSATKRLLSDFKNMSKTNGKFGIHAMPRGDNLFVWDVKLTDFPENSRLGKDLKNYAAKYKREPVLYMEMQFPGDYPMSPPFVRVLRPRMQFLTGHVTIGGSICMELLTKSGWRPTNDIESILINVRSEIMSDKNASLDTARGDQVYTEQEARDAFQRMVHRYNWDK